MSDTTIQLGTAQGRDNAGARETTPSREARLVSASDEIRADVGDDRRLTRVRGEVVRTRNDGSVRIQTEHGNIEVRVQDGAPPPERGQRVEVDIRLPRNEALPADVRHSSSGQTQAPPQTSAPLPDTVIIRTLPQSGQPSTQTRPSATPIEVQLQPPAPTQTQETAQTPRPALPPEGSIVRLTPLTPDVINALPPAPPANVIAAQVIQRVDFQAQTLTQTAAPSAQQALVQTTAAKPTISPPILSTLPAAVAKIVAPALPILTTSGPTAPSSVPQPVLIEPSIPNPVSVLQSSGVNIALPAATPASILTNAPAPTASPLAQDITAQVNTITPPAPQILSGNGAAQTPIAAPTPSPNDLAALQAKPETLILQNQKAGNITGVVTNITQGPLPVVSVAFPQIGAEGLFALQFPSDAIVTGTQIQFTPQSTTSIQQSIPQGAALQAVPLPVALAPQAHWPALEDIAQSLARIAPQSAQAMMNVTPSPANPAQMGPATMFFIAALRGGDLGQWLGDKAQEALRNAGKSSAISKLSGEGRFLSRVAGEPTPQEWRALNIPMAWDGDIQKIALYYRHERDDSADDEQGLKSTRFVFDLTLDAMGKVQLDGLFTPGRLDVALRTEDSFAESTRMEMRSVYARALRDTQITGELSFQNNPENWVTIQADDANALGVSA